MAGAKNQTNPTLKSPVAVCTAKVLHTAVFACDFSPSKWYLGKKYCRAFASQKSWYTERMVTNDITEYKTPTSRTLKEVEMTIRVRYPTGAETAVKK